MSYTTNDPQEFYGEEPPNDWVAWIIILLWALNAWMFLLH